MNEEMTDWLPDENGNSGAGHDGATAAGPGDETLHVGETLAISELQAAADAFNAAFSTALYELESSRRRNGELVARLAELDEALVSMRGALDAEVDKSRRREEEYSREAEQYRRDIDALTGERDRLQQALGEQELMTAERAGDVSRLSARADELEASLAEQVAVSGQERQAHVQERETLAGELTALQGRYAEVENELQARQALLDGRSTEVADLRIRLETQSGELQEKSSVLVERDRQLSALRIRLDTQSEAMREQSEQHANVCEEMNRQVMDTGRELEGLREAYDELVAHAEKLESLNHALHESSVTQGAMHKQQLEKKNSEIELLHSRLDEARARLKSRADTPAGGGVSSGQQQIVQAEMPAAGSDAPRTDQAHAGELEALQTRLADLGSSLDAARAERGNLEQRLREYEGLEQEVAHLRQVAGDRQAEQAEHGEEVTALRAEVDSLRAALGDAERRCGELEAGQTTVADVPVPAEASVTADGDGQAVAALQEPPASPVSERNRFVADLDRLLAERGDADADHNLMYILLDSFAQVRDEIGVMESEHVLEEVGQIIVSVCGDGGRVSRFGDCTFVALCSGESLSDTEYKAERIRAAIESRIFEYGGRSVITTSSIGLCAIRPSDTSARDVIARADLACEAARSYGGNQVLVSSPFADNRTRTDDGGDHEAMVRSVLEEGRARIYYQPITSLKEKSNNCYEILLRIVDENESVILPGEFFAMAGKCGCATEIDRYVVKSVMKMMADNRRQDMTLFVKLTGQTVADHSFPVWVMRKVKEYRINAEHLVFEIPESVLQGDIKNLSMLARALNAIGCGLAVEHYRLSTQLTHLMHIRAQYLKIDSSLVQSIGRKGESLSKVSAIMKMARQNNCITIAEGVETSASLAILCELGVDMAQGYYIQAPSGNRDFDFQGEESGGEPPSSGKATFTIG